MAKSIQPSEQPSFSASVRVPPSHSPPAVVNRDSEPFFQPVSAGRTGIDSSVLVHQSASQPGSEPSVKPDQQSVRSSPSPKRTGISSSAKSQTASQLKQDRHWPRSSSPRCTGQDSSVSRHQSASQPHSDRNRHLHAGTDPSAHRHSSVRSGPTDLNQLWPPTPAHLACTDRDGIVLLVSAQLPVLITPTDHLWIYTQRRENYQRIRTVLLMSPTKLLVKNRLTERP